MTETPNPHIMDPDTLTGEMRPIRPAVVALGSNVGDRLANLQGGINSLADTPGVHVVMVSSVYESQAVGSTDDAPDFLNAILLADTTLSVALLLDRAQAVESAYGRERDVRNAPRTLDVDLIVVGDRLSDTEELTLPHPRAHERAFVLMPWLEIDAEASIHGQGKISDLLIDLDTSGVVHRDDLLLEVEG